jgi:hypothetical protein
MRSRLAIDRLGHAAFEQLGERLPGSGVIILAPCSSNGLPPAGSCNALVTTLGGSGSHLNQYTAGFLAETAPCDAHSPAPADPPSMSDAPTR